MTSARRSRLLTALLILGALFLPTGCNWSEGALVGGALGAGTGAIIGHQSGKAAEGALVGAGVGAVGGAIVGNEMNKAGR